MVSINRSVWRLLDSDVSLQRNLRRGIINIRGLAKFLIQRYGLNASIDAVISAIRRYEVEVDFDQQETTLQSIFRNAGITTRNNLVSVTANDNAKKKIPSFYRTNGIYMGDAPRIITGRTEIKIICTKTQLPHILKTVDKENVMHIQEDLSELGLMLQKEAMTTAGVVARITNEVALNNINIAELIFCPPEIFLYIKETDMVKVHESVMDLIHEKQI